MEYLTNFYKNKCSNLQKKINYLKEEKSRINLAAMYAHDPDLGGGNKDFTGWTQSDHERYKQWWYSLTPQEQKQFRKQWDEDDISWTSYGTGEYMTPGEIPRQFQNPDLPHIILPQRSTGPY